jgi:hypothetical protein
MHDAYTDVICGEPMLLLNMYNFYETGIENTLFKK